MHFIFPTAASSLSLLTMQRVCYNWLEQIYWIGMRRYHRSRVCVCFFLFFFYFYFFSENECSKPLMHLIYVNATRVNMVRSIWFRKIFCTLWRFCNTYWYTGDSGIVLLAWLILCRHQCSCYASVNSSCAQPPSPPPPGYCGAFARLVSPGGWGIYKFCTVRGPGICQPRGH